MSAQAIGSPSPLDLDRRTSSPRYRLHQFDDKSYISSGSSGDWCGDSDAGPSLIRVDSGALAELLEESAEWQQPSRNKTLQDYEWETREKRERFQAEQAAERQLRRAQRPATPPQIDVPGVPGVLVERKPLPQQNPFAVLDSESS